MPRCADRRIAAALAAASLLGAAGGALAGDPDSGRRLATRWCASCHIVAPGAGGSDAARPFESIANDPNFTDQGLRAWLADPHPPMPRLDLSRAQVEDVIAYLKSLRRP